MPFPVSKAYESEMFWERFHHRQKSLTPRGYSSLSQNYTEDVLKPLQLEPKRQIIKYLQLEKAPKEKISGADDTLILETPQHSSQENEKLPLQCLQFRKREDMVLRKHLCRTRQHIVAVKQGRDYFHLLQKEEQEAQEKQRIERERREELRHTELRPPTVSDSDEDSDTKRWPDIAATHISEWKHNRMTFWAARPFTPIHISLTSAQPQLLPGERLYWQLCCLNWLLEALTQERPGRFGPGIACWDAKDPGRSRTMMKRLNKEKAIEAKWEQFIAPPKTRHLTSRPPRISSGRHLTWKSSTVSVAPSLLTVSSVGSLSSLAPAPEHTCNEPVFSEGFEIVKESHPDPTPSEYLQKLLQEVYQNVLKVCGTSESEFISVPDRITSMMSVKVHPESEQNTSADEKIESQRVKSSPGRQTSDTSQLVHEKEAMLNEIKAYFVGKTKELTLSLSDALDRTAKKRLDFGVQRVRSPCNMASRGRIHSAVSTFTSVASISTVQHSKHPDTTEDPYSTQWLSALLSSLAPIKHSDRRITCILGKLSRFTEGDTLRVHPHSFLRVLNSLQTWELCYPDLCVALEIVRQNVVKMPEAEYDTWLHSRVNQSQSTKSATHNFFAIITNSQIA
ncbi:coiled-coil domain-containing protein 60-like [Xyrauchen texanus]|uniref:coiled-coil domain-containing protein 60-like n=1 Tax=Xyrauchen texanus TaxID=154827 RepID=UPI002241D2BB|nr:coiled-coil domain-containing protein 60-like [Xyrauchen texanus]